MTLVPAAQAALPPADAMQPLIIGGEEVQAADPVAAYTVAVLGEDASSGETFICTGSILDTDLVVTAGHCLGEDGKAKLSLAFNTQSAASLRPVAATGALRPAQYVDDPNTPGNMYDIALIHFEGGLPAGYRTATLLNDSRELHDGQEVLLAGYGVSRPHAAAFETSGAGTLRKVNVNIQQARLPSGEILLDVSHGKGSCYGDSGGPAFLQQDGQYSLFGVTSRGTEGCGGEAIYTNILDHQAWIAGAAQVLRR